MGSCSSGGGAPIDSEAAAKTDALNAQIADEIKKSQARKRLLFLGTGASGKSTFMKQIIQNYGQGFTDSEKEWWKNKACLNVLNSLTVLSNEGVAMKEDESKQIDASDDEALYDDTQKVKEILDNQKSKYNKGSIFDAEDVVVLLRLWNHPLIKYSYKNRGEFAFDFGDIEYFFKEPLIYNLGKPEYVMSHDDITYVRSKTNGIYEQSVNIKGMEMVFIDVAGQRSSRKKWIGCFSDVTAVIWVSALDNYNEVLCENAEVNAMDDAMEAFEWAVGHPMLQKPTFALFLNKIDLLERKMKDPQYQLKNFFEDYDGEENNAQQAADFIQEVFLSCVPEDKEVPAYTVQGTDANNANKVLDSVIFGLLENHMSSVFG